MVREKCGTVAGYQQHLKHGETTCSRCRAAKREYNHDRRHNSGRDGMIRWAVLDYVETHGPVTAVVLYELMADRYPKLRLSTVRRELYKFKDQGLVVEYSRTLVNSGDPLESVLWSVPAGMDPWEAL